MSPPARHIRTAGDIGRGPARPRRWSDHGPEQAASKALERIFAWPHQFPPTPICQRQVKTL